MAVVLLIAFLRNGNKFACAEPSSNDSAFTERFWCLVIKNRPMLIGADPSNCIVSGREWFNIIHHNFGASLKFA